MESRWKLVEIGVNGVTLSLLTVCLHFYSALLIISPTWTAPVLSHATVYIFFDMEWVRTWPLLISSLSLFLSQSLRMRSILSLSLSLSFCLTCVYVCTALQHYIIQWVPLLLTSSFNSLWLLNTRYSYRSIQSCLFHWSNNFLGISRKLDTKIVQ